MSTAIPSVLILLLMTVIVKDLTAIAMTDGTDIIHTDRESAEPSVSFWQFLSPLYVRH